jgi:hypothetical protein
VVGPQRVVPGLEDVGGDFRAELPLLPPARGKRRVTRVSGNFAPLTTEQRGDEGPRSAHQLSSRNWKEQFSDTECSRCRHRLNLRRLTVHQRHPDAQTFPSSPPEHNIRPPPPPPPPPPSATKIDVRGQNVFTPSAVAVLLELRVRPALGELVFPELDVIAPSVLDTCSEQGSTMSISTARADLLYFHEVDTWQCIVYCVAWSTHS